MFRRLAASTVLGSAAAPFVSVRTVTRTSSWSSFGVFMAEQKSNKKLAGVGGPARAKALGALYRRLGKAERLRLQKEAAKRGPLTYEVPAPTQSATRGPSAYHLFIGNALKSGTLQGSTSKERMAEAVRLWKARRKAREAVRAGKPVRFA